MSDSRSASDTEFPSSVVSSMHVDGASLKLMGYEGRTKCGNKQWVAGGTQGVSVETGLQSGKSRSQPVRRRLVSLRGHKFLVDSSGKRLQRLPSTPALGQSGSIPDVSKATSATRLLARFVDSLFLCSNPCVGNNMLICVPNMYNIHAVPVWQLL